MSNKRQIFEENVKKYLFGAISKRTSIYTEKLSVTNRYYIWKETEWNIFGMNLFYRIYVFSSSILTVNSVAEANKVDHVVKMDVWVPHGIIFNVITSPNEGYSTMENAKRYYETYLA